jgi:hypothetical protein
MNGFEGPLVPTVSVTGIVIDAPMFDAVSVTLPESDELPPMILPLATSPAPPKK